jgi:peroxin-19
MATELECIEKEETERKKTPSSNQNSDSTKIDEEKTGTRPVSGSEPPPKSRPVFGPEPPPPKTESDVDRTINKLLNDMTSATKETGDDFSELDDVMKELMGDGGDDLIDGMMQQLLTKELMYEPIKQVASKFPQWLKDKKGSLTEEEYNK